VTVLYVETAEECLILFKVKSKIPDFERGKRRILTAGIPVVFRGSKLKIPAGSCRESPKCKEVN
jgi:hypothetical protein